MKRIPCRISAKSTRSAAHAILQRKGIFRLCVLWHKSGECAELVGRFVMDCGIKWGSAVTRSRGRCCKENKSEKASVDSQRLSWHQSTRAFHVHFFADFVGLCLCNQFTSGFVRLKSCYKWLRGLVSFAHPTASVAGSAVQLACASCRTPIGDSHPPASGEYK